MHIFPLLRPNHPDGTIFVKDDNFILRIIRLTEQRRSETPPGAQWIRWHLQTEVVKQGGHEIVLARHCRGNVPLWNTCGVTHNKWDFDGVLVHIQRKGTIPLVPKTVMPAGIAVVAAEDD